MQHKQRLVPVAEAVSGLDDVAVPAIRNDSPQARHHFTQADQVNLLVSASEADPDLGFMARLMVLCSLPRTNPGNRKEYRRVNGPYKLIMTAIGDNKLPYGSLPRLLLAWVTTEAVRTQSRELVLGKSLSGFMRKLGLGSRQRRNHRRADAAPQPGEAALQRACAIDPRARTRRTVRFFGHRRTGGILVERAQARRADVMGEQD